MSKIFKWFGIGIIKFISLFMIMLFPLVENHIVRYFLLLFGFLGIDLTPPIIKRYFIFMFKFLSKVIK